MLAVWQSDRYGVNWMQLVNIFVVRLLLHQFLYSTVHYTLLYSTLYWTTESTAVHHYRSYQLPTQPFI